MCLCGRFQRGLTELDPECGLHPSMSLMSEVLNWIKETDGKCNICIQFVLLPDYEHNITVHLRLLLPCISCYALTTFLFVCMYMCNVHSYIHVHACVGPKGTPGIFIVTKILKKKKKNTLPNHNCYLTILQNWRKANVFIYTLGAAWKRKEYIKPNFQSSKSSIFRRESYNAIKQKFNKW